VINQPSWENEVVAYFKVPSWHLRGSTEHRFAPVPSASVRLSATHLHAVGQSSTGQATALAAAAVRLLCLQPNNTCLPISGNFRCYVDPWCHSLRSLVVVTLVLNSCAVSTPWMHDLRPLLGRKLPSPVMDTGSSFICGKRPHDKVQVWRRVVGTDTHYTPAKAP
jgi:hypothetical protein